MHITERELWTLNFYRNSELHGALLMGRLARTLPDTALLAHATRHCATEARHAAMLSEAIMNVGGRIDPRIKTVQEHYSAAGGVSAAIVDLLILSEILEKRVLVTYRAHLRRDDVHPIVRQTLTAILKEMEAEDHGESGSWLEAALEAQPRNLVEEKEQKWREVDARVAEDLSRLLDETFASGRAAQ